MLKIKELTKGFGDKEVIRNLNLTVQDGSVFGLVGVNGAGKSTLLRLISGVYEPEGGQVLLDGRDTYSDMSARREIAYVSDDAYFPVAATIRSMKKFYTSLYDFDEETFEKYLSFFDLEPSGMIARFSKGMKRKTSLLFALSIHPRLLLVDEAYDGLEPIARLRFKKALTDLIEDERISVIIASHSLKELGDICDSFGILDHGTMLDHGDLDEAREKIGKYQLAFTKPFDRLLFHDFDILHYEQESGICKVIIRGDPEQTMTRLKGLNPVLINRLPVNFEELFIYEVEKEEAKIKQKEKQKEEPKEEQGLPERGRQNGVDDE